MNRFQIFILLILFSGTIQAKSYCSEEKQDSVTSLAKAPKSYQLSGKDLAALAEKILCKNTTQEALFLYLLRPLGQAEKALPAIVYFTGGGWANRNVEGQIPNAAWFRDHGIIGIEADYRVKSRHATSPVESIKDADHSCDWPVSNPNFLPTLQRMTDFLKEQKLIK